MPSHSCGSPERKRYGRGLRNTLFQSGFGTDTIRTGLKLAYAPPELGDSKNGRVEQSSAAGCGTPDLFFSLGDRKLIGSALSDPHSGIWATADTI